MASKYTLRKDTAYPKNSVKSVLMEETLRRLRNCSPELPWKEKGHFLTEYAKEMKASGHSEKFRKEIITRAMKKYENELKSHEEGKNNMYRNREEREKEIEAKGGKKNKATWFRKRGKEGETEETSILRIPYTEGVLKKRINNEIQRGKNPPGTKVKVQEDSGERLLHQLVKPDPFAKESCGRPDCRTVTKGAQGPCRGTCWQQHVNYTVICKTCADEAKKGNGKKVMYIGESSRGCYTRFRKEEMKNNPTVKGYMYEHSEEKHGGNQQNEYVIQRETIDKDVMRRIVRESIRIEEAEEDPSIELLNGKEEHFGVVTVRANFGMDWGQLEF
jgi:hypothetical protein